MNSETILITGASGCVGQYISYWLLRNSKSKLILFLRDPKKLTSIDKNDPRVTLLIGDLREINHFKNELSSVNRVIHTATAWGDPERAYAVNVVAVKQLLENLNPDILEQIIYFSTASILDRDLKPLEEAFIYGTEYIQTKAKCLKELEKHPLAEKIIAVFPTLVFGGKIDGTSIFPTSYLTEGLKEAMKWIWLARWIKAFSKFHFIHAADIAFICGYLATSPHNSLKSTGKNPIRKIVLGQAHISIDHAIKTLREWKGLRATPSIPLWDWLVKILVKILPIEINNWDKFSIRQRHFIHEPITNPESFGGTSHAKNLYDVLNDSGLRSENRRKRGKML